MRLSRRPSLAELLAPYGAPAPAPVARPMRRRLAVLLVIVIAASLVLQVGQQRRADAFVAPSIPVVAATVTAPVLLAVGVAAVAAGAWYAWSKKTEIAAWIDERQGPDGSVVGSGPANLNMVASPPKTSPAPPGSTWQLVASCCSYSLSYTFYEYNTQTKAYGQRSGNLGVSGWGGNSVVGNGSCTEFCVTWKASFTHKYYQSSAWRYSTVTWEAPLEANNERVAQVTATCRNGATTAALAGPVTPYTRTYGGTNSIAVPSCEPILPGSHAEQLVIRDGKTAGELAPIVTREIQPEHKVGGLYDDCINPVSAPCVLRVIAPDGTPCVAGASACVDWWPQSGYIPGYSCKWGPHTLPTLDPCEILKWNYQPHGTVEEDPYAPGVAKPVTTNPDTGTGAQPAPTAGPNPGVGTGAPATGTGSEADGTSGCLATEWSWNPVSWVYAPVKCALKWAFVPRSSVVEGHVTSVKDSWNDTAPAVMMGGLSDTLGALGAIGGGGGCGGPAFSVDWTYYAGEFRPLDACPGAPLHFLAAPVKLLVTVGLYLGLVALAARVLAASLGLNLPAFGPKGDAA